MTTNKAVVVRIHGDKELGGAVSDTLLAKELERTRAELKRVKEELELTKLIRAQEDERRLAEARKEHKRKNKHSLWRWVCETVAIVIIGGQFFAEWVTGR